MSHWGCEMPPRSPENLPSSRALFAVVARPVVRVIVKLLGLDRFAIRPAALGVLSLCSCLKAPVLRDLVERRIGHATGAIALALRFRSMLLLAAVATRRWTSPCFDGGSTPCGAFLCCRAWGMWGFQGPHHTSSE